MVDVKNDIHPTCLCRSELARDHPKLEASPVRWLQGQALTRGRRFLVHHEPAPNHAIPRELCCRQCPLQQPPVSRLLRIGQSGRSSPWQCSTSSCRVSRRLVNSSILRFSSATWAL